MADWNKIKAEYIAGDTSYRKLAKKYGVSLTTLQRISAKENWIGLREQAEIKTETKIINVVSSSKASTGIKINVVANKLLAKMEASIDKLPVIDGGTLKSYTSALKDLKEITGSKCDIDIREQEARIRKLEKEAEKEQVDNEIKVTIEGDLELYSK